MLIIIAVFIVIFVVGIAKIRSQKKRTIEETKQRISSRYKPGELFVSWQDLSIVALNFDEEKVILGAEKNERVYDFRQIVSVDVIENGTTVTSTNRGSQAVGAVVGGLALGGVGAIVGGLSGSSRSQNRIRELSLKVVVDDRTDPVYKICFFKDETKDGADPDDYSVKDDRAKLDRIHAQMLNAMRHAQRKREPVLLNPSAATELQKLWELKQSGILTDEEFRQQKGLLLGSAGQTSSNIPALAAPPPAVS